MHWPPLPLDIWSMILVLWLHGLPLPLEQVWKMKSRIVDPCQNPEPEV